MLIKVADKNKHNDNISIYDKNNDNYDNDYGFEETTSRSPQSMDSDTFRQRNDPSQLLERLKLRILNGYKVEEKIVDPDGNTRIISRIKFKKNTQPRANNQGVEDMIGYLETLVNNHIVQGYIIDMTEYRHKMRFLSIEIVSHFMVNRERWGIPVGEIDELISRAVSIVDLFLTRLLEDRERGHYDETYKETRHTDIKTDPKTNLFQRLGGFMSGGQR